MCFDEVSVCGRRRSGVERLMNGDGVAKIRGEREEEEEEERTACDAAVKVSR